MNTLWVEPKVHESRRRSQIFMSLFVSSFYFYDNKFLVVQYFKEVDQICQKRRPFSYTSFSWEGLRKLLARSPVEMTNS